VIFALLSRIPANALFLVCIAAASLLQAQAFVNGDLEGQVTVTSVQPPGWSAVPVGDPACYATEDNGATADLTNATGPLYNNGIMGNPYSGGSFVSGLHAFGTHHEGIKQTVSGFNVGCSYIIGLYQTVVKQINADATDPSGSWSVYADNTLIGITTPTVSNQPAISLNKPWEYRQVTFIATANTHTLKFMTTDDDADQLTPDGVRMGLDSVFILARSIADNANILGNDTNLCAGNTLLVGTGLTNAAHSWQDGSTATSFLVSAPGIYWVEVITGCGTLRDTIHVLPRSTPPLDLGADAALCAGQTLVLDATTTNAAYGWQDGSTLPTFTVSVPGVYWVDLETTCGTVRDSIAVMDTVITPLELVADPRLCLGASLVLDATTANAAYLWQNGSTSATLLVDLPGTYWVQVTVPGCYTVDSVEVTPLECAVALTLPNIFTPNGDGHNDLFTPIEQIGIRTMRTTIRSRWGLEVYSTASLGINWTGRDSPEGIYYWIIDYTDERGTTLSKAGTLTLLR